MIRHYLFKTRFGWCGVSADNIVWPVRANYSRLITRPPARAGRVDSNSRTKVIKQIVLPGPDKKVVLRRLGTMDYSEASDFADFIKPLQDYFKGKPVRFRYRLDLSGFTDFEKKVYRALRGIPSGAVETYSSIARKVGIPKGARAVGNALAKNPLPIIIPCHRVVRNDGSIGNFSAIGGPRLKKKLLRLEGKQI
ncbi:MAG: methylated-DNA--[protein]-cysteine S-methyltransferase [Planctomycetes bacterium]|nr:methylated-DNA--[protein]-cysteine S-methyltransferase [Planctomycetota bacterium]